MLKILNVTKDAIGLYQCRAAAIALQVNNYSSNYIQLTVLGRFLTFRNSFIMFSYQINLHLERLTLGKIGLNYSLEGRLDPPTEYQIVNVGSSLTISCSFGTIGHLPYYKWKINKDLLCSDCDRDDFKNVNYLKIRIFRKMSFN